MYLSGVPADANMWARIIYDDHFYPAFVPVKSCYHAKEGEVQLLTSFVGGATLTTTIHLLDGTQMREREWFIGEGSGKRNIKKKSAVQDQAPQQSTDTLLNMALWE